MASLLMMSGGIVESAAGEPGALSAYVVLSAGRSSRIFKVLGPLGALAVTELAAATTIDLSRFETELESDLREPLERIRARGGTATIVKPSVVQVCDIVRSYLKENEGFSI